MTTEEEEIPLQTPPLKQKSSMADSDSLYRLETSDNPRTVLVTELLTTENHATWSRAIQRALRNNSKIGLVNGSLPRPTSTNSLFNSWERRNDMVIFWL